MTQPDSEQPAEHRCRQPSDTVADVASVGRRSASKAGRPVPIHRLAQRFGGRRAVYHLACLQLTVLIGGCGEDALAVAILEAMVKPVSKIEPRPRRFMPPPAIPDDVDDPAVRKASGVIKLPHHVRWSGPDRTYNLNDRRDPRAYEQVLQEGLEEDVRYLIDIDKLVELWDELFLPAHVRQAWADWLAAHRGISL